jgi:putative lipoic acid-binding regulatory protein
MEIHMPELENGKPVVEYPCLWGFKVIGPDEEAMRAAVRQCLDSCLAKDSGEREFELGRSRTSKGGKYVSLSLNLLVLDQAERNAVFTALQGRPEILMVI